MELYALFNILIWKEFDIIDFISPVNEIPINMSRNWEIVIDYEK